MYMYSLYYNNNEPKVSSICNLTTQFQFFEMSKFHKTRHFSTFFDIARHFSAFRDISRHFSTCRVRSKKVVLADGEPEGREIMRLFQTFLGSIKCHHSQYLIPTVWGSWTILKRHFRRDGFEEEGHLNFFRNKS